jgi:hypothetical protein
MPGDFGKGSPGHPGWAPPPASTHLRYATVNAPFGRLCFPESSRKPSLGPNITRTGEDDDGDGTAA